MSKIAVIGPKEAVLAFRAVGLDVVCVSTPEEASRAVFRLAEDGHAVIFITEAEAEQISETISRYKTSALPAIIPIPGATGANGYGMAAVRANVEKAIGADILFKEEG
ncbi:MAG: V-type ATP synthase subunit F [Eubacteriales bacterium]|nr:V-type ATP synthase subunit F [Eubacteriales bacterium]